MSKTIFESTPEQAADAAAAALAEGMAPDCRRRGDLAGRQPVGAPRRRPDGQRSPARTSRSAASTATRSASTPATRPTPGGTWPAPRIRRNTVACLILGAYQVAHDRVNRGGDFLHWQPRPLRTDFEPSQGHVEPTRLADRAEGGDPRQRPGPRLRRHPPLRPAWPAGTPGLRPAARLRRQRGRRSARREVLPHRDRGIRLRPARPSAGGSSWPWPASPPASTAAPPRAWPRPASG